MSIKKLKMSGFRNYKEKSLEFSPGVNVIWGENGSGKTATLEAIHILSVGRSFRTAKLQETIEKNSPHSRLVGVFVSEKKKKEVAVSHTKDKRKKVTINNSEVTPAEIFGQNPTVLLSPEEQKITNGSPSDRRKYFDKIFSTVSKEYLIKLIEYNRVLKQRNSLLKNTPMIKEIEAWDEKIVDTATSVWDKREKLHKKFESILNEVCELYGKKEVGVSLNSGLPKHGTGGFFDVLKNNRQKDIVFGYTTTGPHTDKPAVLYNGKNIRSVGSQGEHKISLVLIKLAEYRLIREGTKTTPTVLLDDLFATLDFERSDAVFALLEKNTQTIITNTDLVDIKNHGIVIDGKTNKSIHLLRQCKN